jgi:beta-fructofuranosidase
MGLGPAFSDTVENRFSNSIVTDPNPFPMGQWVHCAIVLSLGEGEQRLYINGAVVATAPYMAPMDPGAATGLGIGVKPNNDGTQAAPVDQAGYWIGTIDEVGLYNAALTAEQVASIYEDAMNGVQLDGTSE